MSTISATRLSSLALAVLVSFDLNVTLPVCASSAVVKGVEEGNVVLRPGGTTVVCVNLAVEEWVEEEIVEKAAVEGIEVVVIRTVVVLAVVVTRTVVVLGVVVVRTVVVPVVVVICSVVDTVVGRLVVRLVVERGVVVANFKVLEGTGTGLVVRVLVVTGEGRSVVVVVGRTVVLRVVGFTVVGRLVVRLVTGGKVVVLTVGRLVVVVDVSRLVVEDEVTS
jgi:hypothetical protein